MDGSDQEFVDCLLKWHSKHRRSFPWRDQLDPYKVFVAEFFLQRTPAERVSKVYNDFIIDYPSIDLLAKANPLKVISKYRQLGLLKRINWLIDSSKIIEIKYDGKIPSTLQQLDELPGIGRYTASAILCFAFNQRVEIIDANVMKLYSRVFNIPKNKVTEKANSILPRRSWKNFNEALLDYSALVCKKNRCCLACELNHVCESFILKKN